MEDAFESLKQRKTERLSSTCSICLQSHQQYLVQCEICKVVVHLDCYRYSCGKAKSPWFCDWCSNDHGQSMLEDNYNSKPVVGSIIWFLDETLIFVLVCSLCRK